MRSVTLIKIIDILIIIDDKIKLRNAELRIYNLIDFYFYFKRALLILIRLNNLIKIILNINKNFVFSFKINV